jgi:hypothetical protein
MIDQKMNMSIIHDGALKNVENISETNLQKRRNILAFQKINILWDMHESYTLALDPAFKHRHDRGTNIGIHLGTIS